MDAISRPRGRRPGNTDTRLEILQAALGLFSRFGYDKVSLRAVAREAEVDPALIHHYFDSKADLFTRAVLDIDFNAEAMLGRVMSGPREEIGRQAVREFLAAWRIEGAQERYTAMFRAAINDEGARRPLVEFVNREIFMKIAVALGHSNAALRANLTVSTLLGLVMTRDILEVAALQNARDEEIVRGMGAAIQEILVERW